MPLSSSSRLALHRAFNGLCHICRQPVEVTAMDIDHLTPKTLGGTDALSNYAPAHARCNRRKKDRAAHHMTNGQYRLLPGRPADGPRTDVSEETIEHFMEQWLFAHVERAPQPSDLVQRFVHHLRTYLTPDLSDHDAVLWFVRCQRSLDIHAEEHEGRWWFV